ncbi:hypothetical protein Rhal01_02253 [Rubritalea halochordaticola]|uniref:Aspartyl protease n=1 Tax=Rubritalea halochordaticola TaxID=714537 RepID=A0ABP9V622_9BACT
MKKKYSIITAIAALGVALSPISGLAGKVEYKAYKVTLTDSLGHFFAPLKIEGKDANFMFDSGAGAYFVASKDFAKSLNKGLEPVAAGQMIDGARTQYGTKFTSLAFGEIKTLHQVQSFVTDLGEHGSLTLDGKKTPVDGLVGSPLMKHLRLSLDYANSTVLFAPKNAKKGTLAYNKKQRGDILIKAHEGPGSRPYVPVTIDGKKFLFLVDSGAAVNILTPEARKHLGIRKVKRIGGMQTVEVKNPQIGHLQLSSLPFVIQKMKAGVIKAEGFEFGGILGSRSLRQYKATLDFDSYHLIFDKSLKG